MAVIVIILGAVGVGFYFNDALAGLGAGSGILGLLFGWAKRKPVTGSATDAASTARNAERAAEISSENLRAAISRSDSQVGKLAPIMGEGKSLEAEGDKLVAGDDEFIQRVKDMGKKGSGG